MRRLGIATTALLTSLTLAPRAALAQPRADGTQRGQRAPVPLDGVAAIVDDAVIFRSDVVSRSKPFLEKLSKDPNERRAQVGQLHKEMLQNLIDEILVGRDAAKAQLTASDAEVSAAVGQIAAANKLDRAQLEAEVKKQGLSQREYEDEIKRQIVEGKWLNLRVAGRIDRGASSDPAKLQQELLTQRALYVAELRNRAYIEIR